MSSLEYSSMVVSVLDQKGVVVLSYKLPFSEHIRQLAYAGSLRENPKAPTPEWKEIVVDYGFFDVDRLDKTKIVFEDRLSATHYILKASRMRVHWQSGLVDYSEYIKDSHVSPCNFEQTILLALSNDIKVEVMQAEDVV